MSDSKRIKPTQHQDQQADTPQSTGRRSLLQAMALGAGAASFYGPWKVNHAWAQAGVKKPLVIGLTMDASGQYAASGSEERLGAMVAIKEFNEKGGVLGRPSSSAPSTPVSLTPFRRWRRNTAASI